MISRKRIIRNIIHKTLRGGRYCDHFDEQDEVWFTFDRFVAVGRVARRLERGCVTQQPRLHAVCV